MDEELQLLIENIGLIYNFGSKLMKKIVIKPFSYKVLMDKKILWNHYMKKLDNIEKSKISEKWLNQLSIFVQKCYKEFVNIPQIKKLYLILKSKNKINDDKEIFLNITIFTAMMKY